jgi:hypothetical protein
MGNKNYIYSSYTKGIEEKCTGFPNGMKVLSYLATNIPLAGLYKNFMRKLDESGTVTEISPNNCGGIIEKQSGWRIVTNIDLFISTWKNITNGKSNDFFDINKSYPVGYRICTLGTNAYGKINILKIGVPYDLDFRTKYGNKVGIYCIIPSWSKGMVKYRVASVEGFHNRFKIYCKQFPYGFKVFALAVYDITNIKSSSKTLLRDIEKHMFECIEIEDKSMCRLGPNYMARSYDSLTEWLMISGLNGFNKLKHIFLSCAKKFNMLEKVHFFNEDKISISKSTKNSNILSPLKYPTKSTNISPIKLNKKPTTKSNKKTNKKSNKNN